MWGKNKMNRFGFCHAWLLSVHPLTAGLGDRADVVGKKNDRDDQIYSLTRAVKNTPNMSTRHSQTRMAGSLLYYSSSNHR